MKQFKLVNGKGWRLFDQGKIYDADFKVILGGGLKNYPVEYYAKLFPKDWEEIKNNKPKTK